MTSPQIDTPRPQRADARRNRALVLEAARRQFAEHGLETQIDGIARQAGVGVGTVYRHFPTKEALLEALATVRFEGMAEAARAALEVTDPWQGFVDFMTYAARTMAEDRGLAEATEQLADTCGRCAEAAGLPELTERLVRRAQASGQLRADVSADDVPALVLGIGRAVRGPDGAPAMTWQRYLEIILAGVRPGAARAS
jgi:AcrR family transcriptional regulator